MTTTVGNKALHGEWEEIGAHKFEMLEDMTMTFEGISCNIQDGKGSLVRTLGKKDGQVTQEVLTGYRCYVIRSRIKFEKKSS
jgi:hypothetical protein